MTIFRCSFSLFAVALLFAACAPEANRVAAACPSVNLPSALDQYSPDAASSNKLVKCISENAVALADATGSNEEIGKSVVTSCATEMGMFELEAGIEAFERGEMDLEQSKQRVRLEAERFSTLRVTQVRAGACDQTK